MNIGRTLGRLAIVYGWQPLGVIFGVFLAFAVVLDQFAGEYRQLGDDSAQLDRQVRQMKAKVQNQKKFEAALQEKTDALLAMRDKTVKAPTLESAAQALKAEGDRLVMAAQGKPAGGTALPPQVDNGVAILGASLLFSGSTEHLVRFLEGAASAPERIKFLALKAAVKDQAAPSALEIDAVIQGAYVLSDKDKQELAAAAKAKVPAAGSEPRAPR